MATLSNLTVRIQGNSKGLSDSLTKAETRVGKFKGRASKAFKAVKLAALAIGAGVVAGVGALVIGLSRSIGGLVAYEKVLRPAIERSRIAAESLQILAEAATRAGSEDGLEAIVDSAQELQLQLGELALIGSARAEDALLSLGLVWEDLKKQSPEEAFRNVLAAIQGIPNIADRAIAAEEIFGGTSEKLAGIINLTTAEFAALEKEVIATSDIWSGEALESAKEFDLELQHLKTELGRGTNALIVGLLPAMTTVIIYIRTEVLPAFKDFKEKALKPLWEFIQVEVVPLFNTLSTTVFPALVIYITGTLIPAWEDLKVKVVEVNDYLSTTLTTTLGTVQTAWEEVNDYLSTTLTTTLGTVQTAWEEVNDYLSTTLTTTLGTVQTAWEEVNDYLSTTLTTTLGTVQTAFIDLKDKALSPTQVSIKDDLLPPLDDLHAMLKDNIEPVILATTEALQFALNPKMKLISKIIDLAVMPVLRTLWKYLGEDIMKVFEAVSTVVEDFADEALTRVKTVWEEDVKPALLSLWAFLTGELSSGVESVKDDFSLMASTFSRDAGVMMMDAENLQEDMNSSFERTEKSIIDHLKEPFEGLAKIVWPLVVETWEEHLKPTFEAIVGYLQALAEEIGDLDLDWAAGWKGMKNTIETVAKVSLITLETAIGVVTAALRIVIALLTLDWDEAWKGAKKIAEETAEGIVGVFDTFGVDIVKELKSTGNTLLGLSEEIANGFIGAVNAMIKAWNDFSLKIPGFKKTVELPFGKSFSVGFDGIDVKTPNLPLLPRYSLPRLADGVQNFRGGPAIVGERGPEIVNLPRGSNVTPNGGGGTTVNINVNGSMVMEHEVIEFVNKARLAWERAGN